MSAFTGNLSVSEMLTYKLRGGAGRCGSRMYTADTLYYSGIMPVRSEKLGFLIDLDGTVYRGNALVSGADRFVEHLVAHGIPYLFITNNSTRSPAAVAEKLVGLGVSATASHVVTAGEVTAELVQNSSVFCIGEIGLHQALQARGATFSERDVSHVVVGLDREANYQKIATAVRCIRAGAKFIATNCDRVLVTENGLLPGAGAVVQAIAFASGSKPLIVGKPERTLIDAAIVRLGVPREYVVVIGDNLETDISAGMNASVQTVLLETGFSKRENVNPDGPKPTWVARDYAELTRLFLSGSAR